MKGAYLENMTWPEAQTALRENPVVLVPIGARCKEHGPHLPLNTDWVQAEYFTTRVVEVLPVLVLPTVQYGYYPAFVEYPGSIHLEADTFAAMVAQICRSLFRHGPHRFYGLNMGVSTLAPLQHVATALAGDGIAFAYSDPRRLAGPVEQELQEQARGGHGDELETSVMLHIAPAKVDMTRAPREIGDYRGGGPFRRIDPAAEGLYSPSGIWGDATLATSEKGALLAEAIVAGILREVQSLTVRKGPEGTWACY
jgi:creatinine amidohydrolase